MLISPEIILFKKKPTLWNSPCPWFRVWKHTVWSQDRVWVWVWVLVLGTCTSLPGATLCRLSSNPAVTRNDQHVLRTGNLCTKESVVATWGLRLLRFPSWEGTSMRTWMTPNRKLWLWGSSKLLCSMDIELFHGEMWPAWPRCRGNLMWSFLSQNTHTNLKHVSMKINSALPQVLPLQRRMPWKQRFLYLCGGTSRFL